MSRRKVVITGAAGYLAGRMLSELRQRYDLTLLDIRTQNRSGEEVEGVTVVDLLDPDRDAYRKHFKGADAIIHCGFVKGDGRETFWVELDNVKMAYNVYQTCVEEGVRRAVVFSSNHAADYYERLIWSQRMEFVTPEMLPLSDNYYGWAKSTYELLGFAFATGGVNDGKSLEVAQLRIGGPRETDLDSTSHEDLGGVHRALGAYLSERDQLQLVVKSVETDAILDENGVPFQIFYGISANDHNFWSIANARRVIGYDPQDNSQVKFADKLTELLKSARQDHYED